MSRKTHALLDCADILGTELSRERVEGYLRLLADIPADEFERAIHAHMNDTKRGAFFPKPAEIRAKCSGQAQGHMPADAAWAIALQSFDENESVVWTPEIEAARNVALTVWESGDKIGARMAFKGAYEAATASQSDSQPKWKLSVGGDQERRSEAVRQAQAAGLISNKQAQHLLPNMSEQDPGMSAVAGLLTGNVVKFPKTGKSNYRRLCDVVKAGVAEAIEREESRRKQAQKEREEKYRDIEEEKARVGQYMQEKLGTGE